MTGPALRSCMTRLCRISKYSKVRMLAPRHVKPNRVLLPSTSARRSLGERISGVSTSLPPERTWSQEAGNLALKRQDLIVPSKAECACQCTVQRLSSSPSHCSSLERWYCCWRQGPQQAWWLVVGGRWVEVAWGSGSASKLRIWLEGV